MKRRIQIVLLTLLVALVGLAGLGLGFYRYAITPVGVDGANKILWIRRGQSFSQTIDQLADVGLVQHPAAFRWLARVKGLDRQIRAGEYALRADMSPLTILETIAKGDSVLHKAIIPEGANMYQIADILERAGLCSKAAFLEAARDSKLLKQLGVDAESFEGYLFPETYYFSRDVTAEQIVSMMVRQFRAIFKKAWRQRAETLDFSLHQIVTLASIVEKETGRADERPLIAAVFHNRLKQGMRLESDPTVIYGLKDFDGNLTRKDLATKTPYNTYRIKGLPPGPIANPGRAALKAVLYPVDETYLYFVSKNDGSHHFSRTFSEHDKMVWKYQRRRSR